VKPIELNLARNPYRNDTPATVGLSLLVVLAVALTGYNAYAYFTADSRVGELERALASHRTEMAQLRERSETIRAELAGIDAEFLRAQSQFVAGVLAESNFSWTNLLDALEETLPWSVQLTRIRPSFEGPDGVTLSLAGNAYDLDAFHDVQAALEDSPYFDVVVPDQWQYESPDDMRVNRVEFSLSCLYVPNALQERDEAGEEAQVAGASTAGERDELQDGDVIVVSDDASDEPVVERGGTPELRASDESDEQGRASAAPTREAQRPTARRDAPQRRAEQRATGRGGGGRGANPRREARSRAADDRRTLSGTDTVSGSDRRVITPGTVIGGGAGARRVDPRAGGDAAGGGDGNASGGAAETAREDAARTRSREQQASGGRGTHRPAVRPETPATDVPPDDATIEELVGEDADGKKFLRANPADGTSPGGSQSEGSSEEGSGSSSESGSEGGSNEGGSSGGGSSGGSSSGSGGE
jgi:Tfp pilus assembly protein PilN